MPELNTLQKWMTSIMVRPGSLPDKIGLADRHYALNHTDVICASPTMNAEEKIGIYARGYVLRLMECMEAEFPALQQLLGGDLFENFARAYLVQRLPNSPDLYDLGQHFPAFLQTSQANLSQTEAGSALYALPVELARFERALAEVSRMPGLEGKAKTNEPESFGFFGFTDTGFKASPCLQLLHLHFPLIAYVTAVQRGAEAPFPEVGESFAIVCRKNYALSMRETEKWQWHFLKALQDSDYLAAVDFCCNQLAIEKETLMADLLLWLPVAEQMGYIYRD